MENLYKALTIGAGVAGWIAADVYQHYRIICAYYDGCSDPRTFDPTANIEKIKKMRWIGPSSWWAKRDFSGQDAKQ